MLQSIIYKSKSNSMYISYCRKLLNLDLEDLGFTLNFRLAHIFPSSHLISHSCLTILLIHPLYFQFSNIPQFLSHPNF